MESNESNWERFFRVPQVPKKQFYSIVILTIAFVALQWLSDYLMRPSRAFFQEDTGTAISSHDFGSIIYPPKLYAGGDQDTLELVINNPFPELQFATVCLDIRDWRMSLGSESSNITSFELKPLETKEFSRRLLTGRAINDLSFDSNVSITAILSLIPIHSSDKIKSLNPCAPKDIITARAYLNIQPDDILWPIRQFLGLNLPFVWPIRQLLRQILGLNLGLNLPYFLFIALFAMENSIFRLWQTLEQKTQPSRMRVYMRIEKLQVRLSYSIYLLPRII